MRGAVGDDEIEVTRSRLYSRLAGAALAVLVAVRVVELLERPGWWVVVVVGLVGVLGLAGAAVTLYRSLSRDEERAFSKAPAAARRRVARAVRRAEPVNDENLALAAIMARTGLRSATSAMSVGVMIAASQALPQRGEDPLDGGRPVMFVVAAGLVTLSVWLTARMRRFLDADR